MKPMLKNGMLLAAIGGAVLLAWTAPLDTEGSPYPYVTSSKFGWCFFKMSPDPDAPLDRSKGFGYAYRVETGESNSLLWSTQGWYSYKVFLSDDGLVLVRLGNWPRGSKPSQSDLAVAFYSSGELIKSYSTADLIQDQSKVLVSASHYEFLGEPAPEFVREPTMLGNDLHFRLPTVDNVTYDFDARTGEIVGTRKP